MPRKLLSLNWLRRRPSAHLALAREGERAATRFLRKRGFLILQRNYDSAAGEVDLICAHGDTVVFVEVKTRGANHPTEPATIVSPDQWNRIAATARSFVTSRGVAHHPCRIDLVVVTVSADGEPAIEHCEGAYQPKF